MRKCRTCGDTLHVQYGDRTMQAASRPNVIIRDCKMYTCDSCDKTSISIQNLQGFNDIVETLPEDNPTPVYFAVDHVGKWFRLPYKFKD